MNREEGLALVRVHTKNQNLVRHMLAVEACMRALHTELRIKNNESSEVNWALAGLLHDLDYEKTKDKDPHKNHTKLALEWLKDKEVPEAVLGAIGSHGWKYVEGAPEPRGKMEWALYTCDELTGLIVAVALVKGGKLGDVEVKSVMKKWNQKAFAAGANREQIALCEEKLGVKLEEYVGICLKAMQGISSELGL